MAVRRSLVRTALLSSICLLPGVSWAQQAPSVMRVPPQAARPMPRPAGMQPGAFAPQHAAPQHNSQQRGAPAQYGPGLPQPTLAPPQPGAQALESEEKSAIPVSAAQLLLKDAADKSKNAKTDGDLSEVIAIAEEALKEKPGAEGTAYANRLLSWSHNRRGQMFAEHKLHEPAVEDFTAAVGYDPSLWRAIHNRGVSLAQLGKTNEALADFNKALQMNNGHPNTFNNRAELYYESGAYDRAWKDFNEAVRANQNDAAYVAGRGKAAAKLGKTREAIQDLDYAVRMDPKNAQLRLVRAELYLGIKGFGTASDDFRAASQLDPQSGAALRGLAWIMATCPDQRLRNAEEAVKIAQKAMELDGNNDPRYVETLAAAYANGGQFEAAAELVKQGLPNARGATAQRMQAQLAVYKEGKPYRDGPEAQQQQPQQAVRQPAAPAKR